MPNAGVLIVDDEEKRMTCVSHIGCAHALHAPRVAATEAAPGIGCCVCGASSALRFAAFIPRAHLTARPLSIHRMSACSFPLSVQAAAPAHKESCCWQWGKFGVALLLVS